MTDPPTVPEELALPPPSKRPPLSELEHAHLATRLAFLLACCVILIINTVPLALIDEIRPTAIGAIAKASKWPQPFWMTFLGATIGVVPFVASLAFWPRCRWRRHATVLAALASFSAGMAWVMLAAFANYLDFGMYVVVLALHGVANLGFGFVLALSRNHELLRELQHWEAPHVKK